jgi:anti-sigma B factor antagonist
MTRESADHTWSDWGKAAFRLDTATGCVVVSAGGEIDLHTAAGLQQALHQAMQHSSCVIIDLSRVSFLDSSGLGVLIGARSRAQQLGGSVFLVRPPATVRKLLVGTRLQQSFPVYESVQEAVDALHPQRSGP